MCYATAVAHHILHVLQKNCISAAAVGLYCETESVDHSRLATVNKTDSIPLLSLLHYTLYFLHFLYGSCFAALHIKEIYIKVNLDCITCLTKINKGEKKSLGKTKHWDHICIQTLGPIPKKWNLYNETKMVKIRSNCKSRNS